MPTGMSNEMLDLAMMEAVVRAVDKISKSVEKLAGQVEKTGKESKEGLDEAIEQNERLDKAMLEVERRFKRHSEEVEAQEKYWARLKLSIKDAAAEYAKFKGLGDTGIKNALGAISGGDIVGAGKQMLAALPFGVGGLLGFALWGKSRDLEFVAAARRSLYVMQQVGGVASGHLGAITQQVRQMYREWGSMGQELEASLSAAAQFNIAEGAFAKTGIAVKGMSDNVLNLTTRMDLLTGSQPGTTMKLVGETAMASGASVEVAARQVARLGASIRQAGLNYTQFAQGIVQATSALRTQNQSLADTQKVFEQLRGGFIAHGVAPARAAQMALEGVQQAGGALAGMPQGLQGLVAQRMARQGVEGFAGVTDPFALLTRFRLGQEGGGDRNFMSQSFRAIKDIIVERIPAKAGEDPQTTELRRIGALARVGGMSEAAARAILRGADATQLLLSPAERTANFTKDLKDAFATRAATQSEFERLSRVAQDDLAEIASSLLTMIVVGVSNMHTTLRALPLLLKATFGSALGLSLSNREQRVLGLVTQQNKGLFDAQDRLVQGASTLFKDLGIFGTVIGSGRSSKAVDEALDKNLALEPGLLDYAKVLLPGGGGLTELIVKKMAAKAIDDAADRAEAEIGAAAAARGREGKTRVDAHARHHLREMAAHQRAAADAADAAADSLDKEATKRHTTRHVSPTQHKTKRGPN